MKWYKPSTHGLIGQMHEVDEPHGSYVMYSDHLEELAGVERRAKKCWLDQQESYWKTEYERVMRDYGHLFVGIV